MPDEMTTLIRYLDAQRESALAILDGLDDTALTTPLPVAGWTPLGLIQHLCDAERYWLQWVLTASVTLRPAWPTGPDAPDGPFATALPPGEVIDAYRKHAAVSNQNLGGVGPDDVPRGETIPGHEEYAVDVRSVILHMIEETARHAGHLDLAREHLDGVTGLGPR